ncbi:hypothetical protein ACFC6L_23100 [Kitasatospora phosalacinea]
MRAERLLAAAVLSATALLTACGPEGSGGSDAASVAVPASPLVVSSPA